MSAEPFVQAFSERLKQARTQAGYSLQEVADRAECSKAHVWDLEQCDHVNPTLQMVGRLAGALNVSPAWLAGWDAHPICWFAEWQATSSHNLRLREAALDFVGEVQQKLLVKDENLLSCDLNKLGSLLELLRPAR